MITIRIIGIDPALTHTGLACATVDMTTGDIDITHIALLKTEKGKDGKAVRLSSDDLRRVRILSRGISTFVGVHNPALVVAEIPVGAQNARAAFSNGVCYGLLAGIYAPMIEVSPREVKLAAVARVTASKAEMIEWASTRWPNLGWLKAKTKGVERLIDDNEHMADACGTIAAAVETIQFAQLMAVYRVKEAA